MVFDIKKRETLRKRLEGYLNEYREFYSEYALDEIEENFLNPYRPIRDSSDVLNQIYAYLGIFDVEKDNAYDMLYGLYPCDATLDMIELASDYDKDLCILACDCYETLDGELDDMNEWIKYIKESIMSCNIG